MLFRLWRHSRGAALLGRPACRARTSRPRSSWIGLQIRPVRSRRQADPSPAEVFSEATQGAHSFTFWTFHKGLCHASGKAK